MKELFCFSTLFIFLFNASSTCVLAQRTSEDTTNRIALENAVRQFGAQSAHGQFNAHIFDTAQDYAQLMADNYYSVKTTGKSISPLLGKNMISHNGFEQRCANFPGRSHKEILATVTAPTREEAAKQIVQNWYKSTDGHKESMMNFHQNFGYGLARTPSPLPGMGGYQWFAVGLFADKIKGYQAPQQPVVQQPVHQQPKVHQPVHQQPKVHQPAPKVPLYQQTHQPKVHVTPKPHVYWNNHQRYPFSLAPINYIHAHQWRMIQEVLEKLATQSLGKGYPMSYRVVIHSY